MIVHAAGQAIRGRIRSLSRGGVLVHWTHVSSPVPVIGTAVNVEIELGNGWVTLHGIVRRSEFEAVAIELYAIAGEAEDRIEREVRSVLEARPAPRVLVVDRSGPRRSRLAAALRDAGCQSFEATTPLEAIDLIESPHGNVAAVAVAEDLTQTRGEELAGYLHDTHPGLKVALIARGSGPVVRSAAVDAVLFGDDQELSDPLIELIGLGKRDRALHAPARKGGPRDPGSKR